MYKLTESNYMNLLTEGNYIYELTESNCELVVVHIDKVSDLETGFHNI